MQSIKYYLLLFIMVAMLSADAQVTASSYSTPLTDRELGLIYKKRSTNLKIIGWCLLGGGLLVNTIASHQAYDFWEENHTAEAFFVIGSAMTIASIPCFIAGAKNKGRAEILLRRENMPMSFKHTNVTSLGVGWKF